MSNVRHPLRRLDTTTFEHGACHAVAHAFHLIEDAAILFSHGRLSTSFQLAVLAREELGRANLLWRESRVASECRTADRAALRKKLSDHIAKLDAGQSTTHIQLPPDFMTAWAAASERNDVTALRELRKQQRVLVAEQRSKDPRLLHVQRMRAQYVDLEPDGTWSRPAQTSRSDAQALIVTVACELSDFLRMEPDDAFAVALAASGESLPTEWEFEARVFRPIVTG